jgi:periplasmic glucans biosynthesis protein
MNRREFGAVAGAAALGSLAAASPLRGAEPGSAGFSHATVVRMARELARQPYQAPASIPQPFADLNYDQYRDIRFNRNASLWLGEDRGFSIEFLHAGFIFKAPIEVNVVEGGTARPITYSPDMFQFGPLVGAPPTESQYLLSGIRIRAPLNSLEEMDEVAVFQGASYFRAVGAGQNYGISARGLAIDTAQPKGEEFPQFRTFWIERPARAAKLLTVHALLDSVSATGAFTFSISPGESTLMGVDAQIFARSDINYLGLAPLTSMYLFGGMDPVRFDDFRAAVHDSDGLGFWRSNGEWVWRSLANPKTLQISVFRENSPKGFGLSQRSRNYEDFLDLEARYEKRPSLWVQPKSSWGEGQIELIEIPAEKEIHDNIAALWRRLPGLKVGESLAYGYWLRWGEPVAESVLAQIVAARSGLSLNKQRRLFVVEYAHPDWPGAAWSFGDDIEVHVSASRGNVANVVGGRNHENGRYRVSFELDVSGVELSELRLVLKRAGEPISETWLYRWTA